MGRRRTIGVVSPIDVPTTTSREGRDVDAWSNILTNFGPVILILFAVGAGAWKVLTWTGRELVIPARDQALARMTRFFDGLDSAVHSVEASVAEVSKHLERQAQAVARLEQTLTEMRQAMRACEANQRGSAILTAAGQQQRNNQ